MKEDRYAIGAPHVWAAAKGVCRVHVRFCASTSPFVYALNANKGSFLLPGNAVPTGRSVLWQVVNRTRLLANLLRS